MKKTQEFRNAEKNKKKRPFSSDGAAVVGDWKYRLFGVITGVVAGIINGLFGGGGGMVVVPMLVFLMKKAEKIAHATAIMIILPMSLVSGLFYAVFGSFELSVGIPVSIGVAIGGVIGALLLNKLTSKWIVVVFSVIMAFAGAKMLFF